MCESFKVKSSIRDYEVHFTESIGPEIKKILKAGDYIIIDNILKAMRILSELKHLKTQRAMRE